MAGVTHSRSRYLRLLAFLVWPIPDTGRCDSARFITWAQVTTSATSPSSRYLSALSSDGERLWLFGGLTAGSVASDELWSYSCSTEEWSALASGGSPPPAAYGATLTWATTSTAVLFGGKLSGGSPSRTAYTLDHSDPGAPSWATLVDSPSGPVARWWHAAEVLDSGSHLVTGGLDSADHALADAWLLDTTSGAWTAISTTGDAPSARYGHRLSTLSSAVVASFGGIDESLSAEGDVFLLNTLTSTWTRAVAYSSSVPGSRYAHGMAVMEGVLCVYGGRTPTGSLLDDLWFAQSSEVLAGGFQWTPGVASLAGAPQPVWGHAFLPAASAVYAFSGRQGSAATTAMAELWRLSLACSGSYALTAQRGNVAYPGSAGVYGNSLDCAWLISRPSEGHQVISAHFAHMDAFDEFDRVYAYDGATSDSELLLSATGSTLPGPIVSSEGRLMIRWVTGTLGTATGFRVAFAALCAPGYYLSGEECDPCPKGTSKSAPGSQRCDACPRGTYAAARASQHCDACPEGAWTASDGSGSKGACVCLGGYSRVDGACTVCAQGAECAGGSAAAVARRGWCQRGSEHVFEHCCDEARCPGGAHARCLPGVPTLAQSAARNATCATDVVEFSTLASFSFSAELVTVIAITSVVALLLTFFLGSAYGWRSATTLPPRVKPAPIVDGTSASPSPTRSIAAAPESKEPSAAVPPHLFPLPPESQLEPPPRYHGAQEARAGAPDPLSMHLASLSDKDLSALIVQNMAAGISPPPVPQGTGDPPASPNLWQRSGRRQLNGGSQQRGAKGAHRPAAFQ